MMEREEGCNFFRSLADRYDYLVQKLDATVDKAIILLGDASQSHLEISASRHIQEIVESLDESVFRFHVWASDLTYQNFVSRTGSLAMRDLKTHDVLNIIDASQSYIVEGLYRIFNQMETSVLLFTQSLDMLVNLEKDERISHYAILDKEGSIIEKAILELDKQKPIIHEQVHHTPVEDMRRGLSNGSTMSAKASVLSIDGGGVRSYSSILIIRALMEEVRCVIKDLKINESHAQGIVPKDVQAADVLEYIIGSSSGGLIAIMLGRLQMSTDQCLKAFRDYADEVFGHPRWYHRWSGRLRYKYNSQNLTRAIKTVVGDFDPSPESLRWKRNRFAVPGERCKTGVTAYPLHENRYSPQIFRTYSQIGNGIPVPEPQTNSQIWEIARATSAAPFYFSPVDVGGKSFIDGGFGINNPAREALREIQAFHKAMSPQTRMPKSLIISVGSGVEPFDSVSDSSTSRNILFSAAKTFITDTEAAHRDMEMFAETREIDYFRFAVDSGLSNISIDSWNVRNVDGKKYFTTAERITEATEKYLEQQHVLDQLHHCACLLVDRCRWNPLSSQSAPLLSAIPSRDHDFVGREDLLGRIQEEFHSRNHVALVGLGGIGKSHIAIEYGYRYHVRHPGKSVFWVNADTSSTFEQGLRSMAQTLKIPSGGEAKANVFQLVQHWLRFNVRHGWLMILDNVGDEDVFDQTYSGETSRSGSVSGETPVLMPSLLPQHPDGQVLITSRSKAIASSLSGSYKSIIEVGPMSADESVDLLCTKMDGECVRDDAQKLAQALGFLPLAIVLAATYINHRAPRLTIGGYMAKFQDRQKRPVSTDHCDLVDGVWRKTFERIRSHKPSAWRLLSLMSLCGPDDIPDYLVRRYQEDYSEGPGNRMDLDIDFDFEDDIFTLTSYSLVKVNSGSKFFSIHRLVQSAVKQELEIRGELIQWKQKYLEILLSSFPKDTYGGWLTCSALSAHVNTALAFRPADEVNLDNWATFCIRVACYAEVSGDYDRAEELNTEALETLRMELGVKHPKTLECLNNLGLVYTRQGRFKEAENIIQRALNGRKRVLGPEHQETMTSQDNRAILFQKQGMYEAAEDIFQQTLTQRRKTLGTDHPDTSSNLYHLASVFRDEGRFWQAEMMTREALKVQERTLGTKNPSTLRTMSNLAVVLQDQDKVEDAERTTRQALEGLKETLGAEHPETLLLTRVLALIFLDQGKVEEAESVSRHALEGLRKSLGAEHPQTLAVSRDLARVFVSQGKFEKAEDLSRHALVGLRKSLGDEHPLTLGVCSTLALISISRRKFEEAESMSQRALEGLQQSLGAEHPTTLGVSSDLARIFMSQGKFEKAEDLSRHTLEALRKSLGPEHHVTLANAKSLASILEQRDHYQAAEHMDQQTLEESDLASIT